LQYVLANCSIKQLAFILPLTGFLQDVSSKVKHYSKLKIVFTIPSSKNLEKTFFKIISTIGPTNIP